MVLEALLGKIIGGFAVTMKRKIYFLILFVILLSSTVVQKVYAVDVSSSNIVFLRGKDYLYHMADHFREAKEEVLISSMIISDSASPRMQRLYYPLKKRVEDSGVTVKVLMAGKYSFGEFNRESYKALKGYKLTPRFYTGKGLLHSKFIIIDEKYIYNGSANFTNSGIGRKEETTVFIENSTLARRLKKYFQSLWKKSKKIEKTMFRDGMQ